jgi:type IV fimbrial biogenesis protein FimT
MNSLRRPVVQRGFTLVELMVVLVIAAILLGLGVPGFRNLIQSQRLTTTVNDLFAAINLTRAEAIKRGQRVDLTPLDGKDWSKGWAVYVDSPVNNPDGTTSPPDQIPSAASDVIIFTSGPIPDGFVVSTAFTESNTNKQYISYIGTGRTRTNASAQQPQLGTLSFTLGNQTRRIKINFLGRARVCNPETDTTCNTSAAD